MSKRSTPNEPPRRRPGNPAMRRGAPSVNPAGGGRPAVWPTLAAAIRAKFPPETIVSLAEQILCGDSPAKIKLRALELLAHRGYGNISRLADLTASARQVTP